MERNEGEQRPTTGCRLKSATGPKRLGRREEKKEEKKNPRDHTALLLSFCERSTACVCSPANLPSRRAASQCSCSRKPSIWICSTIHLCKPAVVKNNHATYFTVSPLTRSRTCARATHTHNAAILIYHLLCVQIEPVFCQVLILACFDGESLQQADKGAHACTLRRVGSNTSMVKLHTRVDKCAKAKIINHLANETLHPAQVPLIYPSHSALSKYLLSAGNGQESAPGQPSGTSRETQICQAVAHAHDNKAAGLQTNLQQVCRARNKHGRWVGRRRA